MPYIIGLDIGATKIRGGLIEKKPSFASSKLRKGKKKIIKRIELPTQAKKTKQIVLKNIFHAVEGLWTKNIEAIGIGVAGQVDYKKGLVLRAANFSPSFSNVPLGKILNRKFKVPVFIDNDAHLFTLAESVYGEAQKHKFVIGITLGTGIGGGIVINKKIYRGMNNAAGEVGHMIIDTSSLKTKLRCGCGKGNHWEAYASGQAMVKLYKHFTGRNQNTFKIEEEAKGGGEIARTVINIMVDFLAQGLANIIHILNPEIIAIGGGLSRVDILISPAIYETKKLLLYPSLAKTKIVKSKLGQDAGILGAALITRT